MSYLKSTESSNKAKFPIKKAKKPLKICRYCNKEITKENAYEIYHHQYETLWNYVLNELNFDTKIFNLGEDCEFNFSSIWSKKYFPLTDSIRSEINIK